MKRKLIEVALPLEVINRESAREKSIRQGHPSTLHIWWARRPLAACRAVLFAQLVDDPSARIDEFPTVESQAAERRRLFDILERLVVWENTNDRGLLREANAEVARSFDGELPAVRDPFAGGGSIPLEAQRLGLAANASDLNPVAVLINQALIEIPGKWVDRPPVFPHAAEERLGSWAGAGGLAEDIRRYANWMRDQAAEKLSHLYPEVRLPDGSRQSPIAWLWARTVTCPNPACRAAMPLVSSLWLSKNRKRLAWLRPIVTGTSVSFEVCHDPAGPRTERTAGRTGARCLACGTTTDLKYIRTEGFAGRVGQQLLATVAQVGGGRAYLPADVEQETAGHVSRPDNAPEAEIAHNPRYLSPPLYGMTTWTDLFTNRQLTALMTFADLVGAATLRAQTDAQLAGWSEYEARNYASDVAVYLAFVVSNSADDLSSLVTWRPSHGSGATRGTFARQALAMTWDFAEANPTAGATADLVTTALAVAKAVEQLPARPGGRAFAADAAESPINAGEVVSTDPPYYDNIGYADLSDFFYVWLRTSLAEIKPELFATVVTPKSRELVASPYRFDGDKKKAERHFEAGFIEAFTRIRTQHRKDVPLTVFYAFKQAETDDAGTASTGWETMLSGLIAAGLTITATWPIRTERSSRTVGIGTNALASSIVLACRPQASTAEVTSRRGFISALKAEFPEALRAMQQGSLAPVDLAQAAIGPGMATFTRFRSVVETDGSPMTVRTALALINHVLDEVLSEQEGDFDSDTRFCVKWFTQYAWNETDFGNADQLSRSTNTSVDGLVRGGIFWARAGRARLLGPEDLASDWNPIVDERVSVWEAVLRLAKALDEEGGEEAARLMAGVGQRVDLDAAKELAYLLFSICEKRGWTDSALLFNGLGTSWSDLSAMSRTGGARTPPPAQGALDFDETEG